MATFIILCVLMAVIAVAAVAYPLWTGGRSDGDASQREQVLGILRQQAADLEAERAAGRIDQDEYEETRMELERRVLEEARQEEAAETGAPSRGARQLALVLGLIIPVGVVVGYLALGRYDAMDPAFLRAVEEQAAQERGHSAAEMQAMVEDLKKQLEANPQNAEGWYMLARAMASMNRYQESLEAFKKLNELVPNNADLLADQADMMAAANGKTITPEVVEVLERALDIDPNQWKALMLMALHSWDKQRYLEAAGFWEHLLQVLPPDDPDRAQLEANIEEAKRLAGVADGAAAAAAGESVPTASPANGRMVGGTVAISDELKAKAGPGDTVFIYARPVAGSRMPVAFMKVTVKDLPFKFRLDESMTMAMGADTLRNVEEVIVGARISKTGNFMPQTGDFEGETVKPVKVGAKDIEVMITNVRP